MRNARWCLAAGVLLLVPTLALAGGFALFEHGARGVGMAGAFGATADDPSAGYYNPAGLAFLEGTQLEAGVFLITETSKFKGVNPYPGAGYKSEMESQVFYPPHLYLNGRLTSNDVLHWGVAVYAPFGLGTWWPNEYAGKFITKRIDLKVFNINPNLAIRLSDSVAVAVGYDLFLSRVDLTKSLPAFNPYTLQVAEVGQVHLYNDNWETGSGWNAAILAKLGAGFSFGASYRDKVKMTYSDATASFIQFPTGYADFDAIVAGLLPFANKPKATTSITFPSETRFGLAWRNEKWTVEYDAVRMGWDVFKNLPITIVGRPDLSSVRPEEYKNTTTHRIGFEYRMSPAWAWQFGYLKDPTPVPTASVSPLLPDADRNGYSLGFSWAFSERSKLESSFLYLPFKGRSTNGQDRDNFNGSYDTTAYLWGLSWVYKF
ncbi:MAG: OmpP1/FadL family transporter [Acidobacteriota bacterium]